MKRSLKSYSITTGLSLLVMFLLSSTVFGLDAKEIIAKMQENYAKAERLEYASSYELFKGHTGEDLAKRYSGYFYRDGEQQFQKMGTTEYVYNSAFFLAIDHEEKELVISKSQKVPSADMDIAAVLKACSATSITESVDNYIIVLEFNTFSNTPFSSVVLLISRSEFLLKQLDFFYAASQDFSEDGQVSDLHKPHLRIAFTQIKLKAKQHSELFELSTYTTNTQGTLAPKELYLGYIVRDNRIK